MIMISHMITKYEEIDISRSKQNHFNQIAKLLKVILIVFYIDNKCSLL